MIDIPVHDRQGKVLETIQFDEACLGKFVNMQLLHQAIVMYEANRRQGTVATKGVRSIVGTSRKPHKQKGTGRARQGRVRRVGSRGGGTCHGPVPRDYRQTMSKKARRNAIRSALLGKFRDSEIIVVDELEQDQPKTKDVAITLKNLKIDKGCLVVTNKAGSALWKSVRNIPATELVNLSDINAYSILLRKNILITKAALEALPQEVV